MFAAVGNDGMREVVYGIGDTEDAALSEAARRIQEQYGAHADVSGLDLHPITPEQRSKIESGVVWWETLNK